MKMHDLKPGRMRYQRIGNGEAMALVRVSLEAQQRRRLRLRKAQRCRERLGLLGDQRGHGGEEQGIIMVAPQLVAELPYTVWACQAPRDACSQSQMRPDAPSGVFC